MALATLSIDLEANFASLQQGLNQAAAKVRQSGAQMQGTLDQLGNTAALFSGVLKGAFAGLGVFGAANAFIGLTRGVDALNDFADATGATIENASALEDVAARTGTSFQTVEAAVLKLNKVLSDAKPGSDQAAVLKTLGLSADELRKQDPAEALRQVSVALAGFADGPEKARFVLELFGKSTREVAPLLNDLAKQSQLVATVTKQQAEEAEKFNQQLAALSKNSLDLARNLAGPVVASLNEVASRFRQASKDGNGWLDTLLGLTALGSAAGFGKTDAQNVQEYGNRIAALTKLLENENVQGERRVRLQTQLDGLRAKVQNASPLAALSGVVTRSSLPTLPDLPTQGGKTAGAPTAKTDEVQRYIERLEQAELAALKLSNTEQVQLDIVYGKLRKATEAQKERALSAARSADALGKKPSEPALFGPEIDPALIKQRADAQRELNKLLGESDDGRFNSLVDLTNSLIDAQRDGSVSATQYASAMAVLQKRFEDLTPQAKETLAELDEFSKQAARNIQDTLGSSVASLLKGDFKSIEDSWKDMLANMAAQALAAQLNRYLFGSLGSTGNLGGVIGQLISGSAGGGSNPSPGGPGVIGIESVVGRATAQRAPIGARDGGVAAVVNQTVHVGQGVSRGEVTAAVADGNRALLAQLRASGQIR